MYHHLFELSFRYRNHTLISQNFLIRTYQLLLTCFQLPRSLVKNLQPSANCCSGHFEFKILWSPTVVHLQSAAFKQEIYPYAMPEALAFFLPPIWERNWENFAFRKFCLSHKPAPWASSKKCVQVLGTDDAALSASTVEYEFHPHILQIERCWLRERACHSMAAHPVCSVQEWSTHEYFARNH